MDIIKREELPKGYWDEDLDTHPEHKYKFNINGYECEIKRNIFQWFYCGYVYLPIKHPDFNKPTHIIEKYYFIHGGITYSENGKIGFDCHHITRGDIGVIDIRMRNECATDALKKIFAPFVEHEHYWTYEEVYEQLVQLVKQVDARK